MANTQLDDKYWVVESKSYMKHFQERCKGQFEPQIHRFLSDCVKAKGDSPHFKLWTCFQSSCFLGTELNLQLTQFYLKGDWLNYLTYRQLIEKVYGKIFEWVSAVLPWDSDGVALKSLRLGLINQIVLPLVLSGDKTQSLSTFQVFLDNPAGTSTGFRPDLTEIFLLMVKHKLAQTALPPIERFEPGNVYEHLAWRYKYCLKPSNEVDYALALIPEELIAYHMMRGTNVDMSLLSDGNFKHMQTALDIIRHGEAGKLQVPLLIDALHQVSELEYSAYQEIGEKTIRLDTMLDLDS
jgi:hypothetical protein